jgi:hypothetical protein
MGVPVTLLYLGFCGDHGLIGVGDPLACEEHWYSLFRSHCSPHLLMPGAKAEIGFKVSGVPVWIAMRARTVLSQSPPVAV